MARTYYHLKDGSDDYSYYCTDNQGSVTHIVDGNGLLNQYEYDAFGNTLSSRETVPNRFRYTGQQYDPVTNQYYLRARYYNPVIARFLQEDTYLGDGLNLFAYCQNNPLKYYDPSGHSCDKKGNQFSEGG